jgi:glycosyltransferase involved in cell wall biosynthesis
MRILQIVHSFPFINQAGTEVYTYNLSLELSKRHEVYVFTRICNTNQKDYEVTEQNINGITVYLINNTFKYCNSFEMYYENGTIDKKFTEILDEIKPDIVHIQHLVFLSTGLIKKINNRGIPIVFTLHDYWLMCPKWHLLKKEAELCDKAIDNGFDQECCSCLGEMLNIKRGAKRLYIFTKSLFPTFLVNKFKKIYFLCINKISNGNGIGKLKDRNCKIKSLLNTVDIFLSPSIYLRDKFIAFGIPGEKVRLSRYGLDSSLFMDSQKTKADKIRFGFIGTILPAKGLHILIKAFNEIKYEDVELKIYGKLRSYIGFEYYLPSLKKMIKNKNIRFRGEFNNRKIADIFKEIDVLVIPSIWHENSPLVIQEAFLSKTPVIASRVGGIPELVKDGVNGLLFNPQDTDDLLKKLEYVINNREVINEFKKSMPKIKNIEENTQEIEKLYKEILKRAQV